jgi:hypothetical protein
MVSSGLLRRENLKSYRNLFGHESRWGSKPRMTVLAKPAANFCSGIVPITTNFPFSHHLSGWLKTYT